MEEIENKSIEEIEKELSSIKEEIEPKIEAKSYAELEKERKTLLKEKEKEKEIKTIKQIIELIEDQFPTLKIEETIEYCNKIKDNPQCSTCSRFYSQSNRVEVKKRMKGLKTDNDQPFLFRIYKNSAEKLKDSKGYCCYMANPVNHTKTIIPVPDLSLCSEWTLHNNLSKLFTFITQTTNKHKEVERIKLEDERDALENKLKAEQVIKDYNKLYQEEK